MTEQNAQKTKRIAKNTLLLYVRMLFGMLVSLYTSRVVLQALGVEDYGIYNVVGGFVAMFSILSGSLSAAVSRFLTFELGKGDQKRLQLVFSTSLNIHIFLAIIIIVLSETIGLWFLNNEMVIPQARIGAANVVFQCSVISFVMGLLSVSYNASIISHEKMSVFAYIGVFDILIKLFLVLFIAYSPFHFDRLIVYALSILGVSFILQLVYYVYCRRSFIECRYQLLIDRTLFREVASFAGWNFIGASSSVLRDQGGNVLLNLFFGPAVNAVRGISQQVSGAVNAFVGNFMVAVNPQITKSYASENYDYMMSLIFHSARYSFYLLFLLSLPILIHTDYVLTLWLGQCPEHAVIFVRLILIFSLGESISQPLVTSMLATGKIKKYQIIVGGIQMMNFPLSYAFLKFGYPPECILYVAVFLSFSCLLARLILLRKMINLPARRFVKEVFFNVFVVSFLSAMIPVILNKMYFADSFAMFCLSVFFCILCSATIIFYVGCFASERKFVLEKIFALYKKIRLR